MLAYGVDMDVFLNDFRKCIQSIVVKRTQKAVLYETADIKREADRYVAMMDGMTEWASFGNFDYEVLVAAGLSSDIITNAISNKELIPYDMRQICMNLQRQYVIDNYVEKNDYYRTLNGLPPINEDEKKFVYVGPNDLGLPESTPVHLMTLGQQDTILTSGLINTLLEKYPDKEYINHIGMKKISPYKARSALNYQILYMENSEIPYISNDFSKFYANARNYVMKGLYNNDDRTLYDSYDAFMGFTIIVMAINRVFGAIFKQGITREFYDDNLIRDLFQCYNIPYEESIDLKYQRELAKKLNVLLQKKSSNNVLVDIKSLFNYNQVNIYQYYLMKDYKHDDNGDPIIIYKHIVDEEGNEKEVIDYEKTFDIYFQKVNIATQNKAVELTNPSNRINYVSLVGDDPYWSNDSDLINKIYTNSFNSIITKYMSIDVAYDVSKLMYEVSHAFRLIFDANEHTKNIRVILPYVDDPVSLYDTVTFVCALLCKKFKLSGEIPLEPWNVANVYGFNFKTDIEYLRDAVVDDIDNNSGEYSHVDPEVLKYLKIININSIEDVRKLFDNMEDLRIFLDNAMRLTQDLDAYNAYKKLYNAILVTTDMEDVYTKNDGTYAHTYMELLEDRRPDLAEVVRTTEDGTITPDESEDLPEYLTTTINAKLNKTLDILSDISDDLSDLRFANEKTEIVNNIEKVINQMKSYTVDMQDSGILYVINDPHMCMLKILDYMKTSGTFTPDDGIDLIIDDVIGTMRITNKYSDKILHIIDQEGDISIQMLLKDLINFVHRVQLKVSDVFCDKKVDIVDVCSNIYKDLVLPTLRLRMEEFTDTKALARFFECIGLNNVELWNMVINQVDREELAVYDSYSKSSVTMAYLMCLALKDQVISNVKWIYSNAIQLINDIWRYEKHEDLDLSTDIIDIIGYSKNTAYDTSKKKVIRDFLTIKRIFKLEDYIWLRNQLLCSKETSAKLALDIIDALGLLARDAISQKIIVDQDFDTTVRVVIPSYLKMVNQLTDIKNHEDSNGGSLYKLFGEVLTDMPISSPPTVKDSLVESKTLLVNDKMTSTSDSYLDAIQTPRTNMLSRALASVRSEPVTRSLSNDVLGIVYGLDGSVEIIGRNNTLEANNNNATKGVKLKDSLTIIRD